MYLFISKIVFAVSIFSLTLITGLIPLKIVKHNARLLSVSDAFARGIFLSTALLHLLPDAATKFCNTLICGSYPLAYLICITTFILLLIMERGIYICGKIHFSNSNVIAPTFLVLLLTTHSLIEGAAVGINISFLEAAAIFLAVLAHKGSESFALSVNLHRFGMTAKTIRQVIIGFSLMTPLGIFIASSTWINNSIDILGPSFSAIAAGTFLYLGTEHIVEDKKSFEKPEEVIALILGITVMALVAVWV